MVRAAIYTRLSRALDGSYEKVDRQEGDCRDQASRLGWDVTTVYCDNNLSAWKRTVRREGWEAMLLAIDAGELDALITWHGDRLIRQPWDLERLLTIADERALLLASVTGLRDLSNADDRFILRVEVAHACRSSDDTSRRTKRGNRARAEKGIQRPGLLRPYGFEEDCRTHRESEAAVIRETLERLVAGEGYGSICRRLNERGETTVTGAPWRYGNLRSVVLKPSVAGYVTYRGAIIGRGQWEPIADPELWEAARQVTKERADARGNTGLTRDRTYLLSGIAKCGTCGHGMYGTRTGHRPLYYFCRNETCTRRLSRSLAPLDTYVEGVVVTMLSNPTTIAASRESAPDPKVPLRITALEARRSAVLAAFGNPDADAPEDLVAILGGIDAEVAQLRTTQVEATRGRAVAAALGIDRAGWEELGLSRQRTVIRELVTVTVLPVPVRRGRGFDPAYVRVDPLY